MNNNTLALQGSLEISLASFSGWGLHINVVKYSFSLCIYAENFLILIMHLFMCIRKSQYHICPMISYIL